MSDKRTPIIDGIAPGKHVKVRGQRYFDGVLVPGHHFGVVREVKPSGTFVLDNGWHMHPQNGDEVVWCADTPAPAWVQ
jgi:hypothetical protein